MKRIYLSGPMTGRPDLNFPAFHAAAARLRALGYQVVSPAEIVPGTKTTWHDAMRADIKDLLDCDTLALLEGWQESAGAHLEMHVAHRVGIKIVVEAEITEKPQPPLFSFQKVLYGSQTEPVIATNLSLLVEHQNRIRAAIDEKYRLRTSLRDLVAYFDDHSGWPRVEDMDEDEFGEYLNKRADKMSALLATAREALSGKEAQS